VIALNGSVLVVLLSECTSSAAGSVSARLGRPAEWHKDRDASRLSAQGSSTQGSVRTGEPSAQPQPVPKPVGESSTFPKNMLVLYDYEPPVGTARLDRGACWFFAFWRGGLRLALQGASAEGWASRPSRGSQQRGTPVRCRLWWQAWARSRLLLERGWSLSQECGQVCLPSFDFTAFTLFGGNSWPTKARLHVAVS
jgi:hypothetical protein